MHFKLTNEMDNVVQFTQFKCWGGGMQILEISSIFQLNFSLSFIICNIRLLDPTVFYYNAQQIIQFIQISAVKSIHQD